MANETPLEDVLLGFASYAETNLPTYLEEINTAKADGIELSDFEEYTPGWKTVFGRTRYPVMLFAPDLAEIELSANRAEYIYFPIDVFQGVKHSKPNTLIRLQLRYADAFRNLMMADRTLGGLVEFSEIESVDPYFGEEGLGVNVIRARLTIEVVS